MGIDEIKSQSQGGRLASADGGCIERREVGASIGAAVSIQDNQRHPAARAGNNHCQRKVEMSYCLQSRNVRFVPGGPRGRGSLGVPVKRRRAMLASNPIKE